MSVILRRGGVSTACVMLAVWTASAAELSRYREFELGTTSAMPSFAGQLSPADIANVAAYVSSVAGQ